MYVRHFFNMLGRLLALALIGLTGLVVVNHYSKNQDALSPAPTTEAQSVVLHELLTQTLGVGSHHAEVAVLQHYLNTHSFPVATTGAGSLGNESLSFGPATQSALVRFQSAYGINPTGLTDPDTRAFINAHP